jgi:hypothetical protein
MQFRKNPSILGKGQLILWTVEPLKFMRVDSGKLHTWMMIKIHSNFYSRNVWFDHNASNKKKDFAS